MAERTPVTRRRLIVVNLAMLALGVGLLVPWRLTAQADQTPRPSLASPSSHSVAPDPWDRLEELAGSIVTPDGVPIPGAKIRLVVYDNDRNESVVIASTLSDARGRFAFREPRRLLGQYSRPLTVVAQAPGWGLSLQSIFHAQEKVEITAIPRTRLVLPLTDANGKPAQGVQATISMLTIKGLPGAHLAVPAEMRSEFATESNAQGICEFEGLPQEGIARVKIEDERFAQPFGHRDLALGTLGPDEFRLRVKDSLIIFGRRIPLTPAVTISGRAVYESTGKPAAGIRVGAQQIPGGDVPHTLGGGSAVTDSEGRYTVKQLVPGRYNVALDLRGELNRSWTAVAHEDVILNHGDHLEGVDFALIPGAVIAGKVTGQDTGAPVAGVLVGVYGPAHPRSTGWVQNTETEADGSYFLRVPAGTQYLYLQGTWPAGFSSPGKRSYDVQLEDGETRRVDFALSGAPLKPIHGRVLGPDEKPIPGAEVIVLPSWRIIETGADGEFALGPAKVKLRARQGNLATERAGRPSTEGEVVLRLKEDILASVTGLVTDATEKPVTDAHVCLFVGVYGQWLPVGDGVRTDAEGRYRFASLWPHQIYQVAVRQKSAGREPGSDTTFELGTGEIRELPTLRAGAAAPRG